MKCLLCNTIVKNVRSLSKHLRDHHKNISSKEYYDQFLKEDFEDVCDVCENITKFINLGSGYKRTCSHICGGILHRKTLSENLVKDMNFRKRVSINQEKIWNERKEIGKDVAIRAVISLSKKQSAQNMTPEERKIKFGWLNHVIEEEKREFIKKVLKKTGMVAFWNKASEEEKRKVIDKRMNTMVEKGYATPRDERDEVELYYCQVRYLTEKTYLKHIDEINPKKLERGRGGSYVIDHIVSICDGYLNNVEPHIIASKHNLQMLTAFENGSKGRKSWMEIEVLQEKYQNGR